MIMRAKISAVCLALFLFGVVPAGATATVVTVSGRKLMVAGVAFTIKGVCYSPTPAGSSTSYNWYADASIYKNDFALLKAMGVNTIRVYGAANMTAEFLDAADQKGIHVIMGYWVDASKVGVAASETAMVNEFATMINKWKAYPAVLLWMFGNEVDANVSSKSHWYTLLNTACVRAHAEDANHPVGTVNQEITEIGDASVKADTTTLSALDIWGINLYRGSSFGNAFSVMSGTSTGKAYFISEWGCDAYNGVTGAEDRTLQNKYIKSQWAEIAANLSADGKSCSGGTVFEWSDEWWKGDSTAGNVGTIGGGGVNGNSVQDTSADWQNPHGEAGEDPNMNEEWWGIVGIAKNTNDRTLRPAYYALQQAWYVPTSSVDTVDGIINPNIIFQGEIHSFPNPFRAGIDDTTIKIVVSGSPDITVEIFDLSGKKVCSISDSVTIGYQRLFLWRGKDSDNETVTAGLYICKITAKIEGREEIKFRKIAVAK